MRTVSALNSSGAWPSVTSPWRSASSTRLASSESALNSGTAISLTLNTTRSVGAAPSALGRRAVEFHEEWFDDGARVTALLETIVHACPGADWAFERLKLAYDAAERYPELFALFDNLSVKLKVGDDGADVAGHALKESHVLVVEILAVALVKGMENADRVAIDDSVLFIALFDDERHGDAVLHVK